VKGKPLKKRGSLYRGVLSSVFRGLINTYLLLGDILIKNNEMNNRED
jgi:hypothetical protein